ncbi:MAG: class II glutamine amidotransferase [Candidatus Sumerlaeaceae bacterium]|nr:class II glutamine amidotransferase [Candidatus Sumerlaeaceae bacterium]
MCRMVGFSASSPQRIGPFLEAVAFQAQHGCRPWGRPHGDGWGMVIATAQGWFQTKSDRPIWDFPLHHLANLEATCGLVHARLASPNTPVDITKVHPFSATLGERTFAFCHNGSISKAEHLLPDIQIALPPKAIDTEIYFGLVQQHLGNGLDAALALREAARKILSADCEASSLNALLLTQDELVALRGPVTHGLEHYYTLYYYQVNECCVISTESHEQWGEGLLLDGTLVVRDGQLLTTQPWP